MDALLLTNRERAILRSPPAREQTVADTQPDISAPRKLISDPKAERSSTDVQPRTLKSPAIDTAFAAVTESTERDPNKNIGASKETTPCTTAEFDSDVGPSARKDCDTDTRLPVASRPEIETASLNDALSLTVRPKPTFRSSEMLQAPPILQSSPIDTDDPNSTTPWSVLSPDISTLPPTDRLEAINAELPDKSEPATARSAPTLIPKFTKRSSEQLTESVRVDCPSTEKPPAPYNAAAAERLLAKEA
jgi:hypothetical protein